MQHIRFGNKKALKIVSNDMKNHVKNSIKVSTGIDITGRNYGFLNEKNMHHLKNQNYQVCLNTFGKKFLLYLTKFQDKIYTIFINRKQEDMISIQLRFSENLYQNSLFDGELIKNTDDEWVYAISDIISYSGSNIRNSLSLNERLDLVQKILDSEFEKNDEVDICKMDLKKYFELEYLEDLSTRYINSVPYRCSGLYFQHKTDSSRSYMFIFPENRTNEIRNQDKKEVESLPEPKEETVYSGPDVGKPYKFWVKITDLPDIYELYLNKNDENRFGIAGISNLEISKYMSNIFASVDEDQKVQLNCVYKEGFNKWFPQK